MDMDEDHQEYEKKKRKTYDKKKLNNNWFKAFKKLKLYKSNKKI